MTQLHKKEILPSATWILDLGNLIVSTVTSVGNIYYIIEICYE